MLPDVALVKHTGPGTDTAPDPSMVFFTLQYFSPFSHLCILSPCDRQARAPVRHSKIERYGAPSERTEPHSRGSPSGRGGPVVFRHACLDHDPEAVLLAVGQARSVRSFPAGQCLSQPPSHLHSHQAAGSRQAPRTPGGCVRARPRLRQQAVSFWLSHLMTATRRGKLKATRNKPSAQDGSRGTASGIQLRVFLEH